MHVKLNRKESDHHVVNQNCHEDDADVNCDKEEHHIIVESGMKYGEEARGLCSEMVVGRDLLSRRSYLYGSVTVACERGMHGAPKLRVAHNTCRELRPLSVSFQHSISGDATPRWVPTPAFQFGNHHCGDAPTALVLPAAADAGATPTMSTTASPEEAYARAVAACAAAPACQAASVDRATGQFQLLRDFACRPGPGPTTPSFAVGDHIRWWAHLGENPKEEKGMVLKAWSLESDADDVVVEFPGLGVLKLPPDSLELVGEVTGSVVASKVRKRKVECEPLQAGYSCDVYQLEDVLVLFEDSAKSLDDCQTACGAAAVNASLASGCCALFSGVCALTRGEHFKLLVDDVGAEGGKYPQKRHNRDPKAEEFAGRCTKPPCTLDRACAAGMRAEFMPPPDVPTEAGQVTLYFDFAHPLSLPFVQEPAPGRINIYHFTSYDEEAGLAIGDAGRLVRAVGSLPLDSPLFEKKPNVKSTGFMAKMGSMPQGKIKHAQDVLDKACSEHGKVFGRKLAAPRMTATVAQRGECLAKHSSTQVPGYEPCLVRLGCKAIDPQVPFLPFHGPGFPKLPFDSLAWQQPAPFCCAVPYNYNRSTEFVRKAFFGAVGLRDAQTTDLNAVVDERVRGSMSSSLLSGSKAMTAFLSKSARDEPTLAWLSQFTITANRALAKFMQEMQNMVDLEGGGAEDYDEISENSTSFLRIHEAGDVIAPSGRRAFEVARWSEERGAFIQVGEPDVVAEERKGGLLGKIWEVVQILPGAVYSFGIKPVWNFMVRPLAAWGISLGTWIVEHPRAALFISKIALTMRERLCEKASITIYGESEVEYVGLLTKVSESASQTMEAAQRALSPAVLLLGLQKALGADSFLQKMSSLGKAAFGMTMTWAGLASGGVGAALISSLVGLFADAAIDAGKQAFETLVYQELAKEIPSNLYDMLMSKCLYKKGPVRVIGPHATLLEFMGGSKAQPQTRRPA